MHVVLVIADHRHLGGVEAGCGAEAQEHAGARLDAMATVVAGDEIEESGKAQPFRGAADRQFVIAGGDAELQAARLEAGKEDGKIRHRNGEIGTADKKRIERHGQFSDING